MRNPGARTDDHAKQDAAALLGELLASASARSSGTFPSSSAIDAPDMPKLRYADGVYIEKAAAGWSARIEFAHPAGSRSSFSLVELPSPDVAAEQARAALASLWEREAAMTEALPPGSMVLDLAGITLVVGSDDVEKALSGRDLPTDEQISDGLDRLAAAPEGTMESVLRESPDAVRAVVAAVARGMRVWPVATGHSSSAH